MIPLRVLIVEDNPDDAEIMVLHLVQEGFQLDWQRVETEADFLSGLKSPPDLILSDWRLPYFSGQRALELLIENNLEVPFVIVSGSIGEESAIDSLRAGAHDYVLKDRLARLGQAVRGALKEKQLLEERRQANRALRDSEEKYRSLYNSIRDAILVADTNRNIIDCNPALTSLFGYTRDEILGQQTVTLYENEVGFNTLGKALQEHDADSPFLQTVNYKKKTGEIFPGETGVFYLKDDQRQVTGFIGLIRDISERVQAEGALRNSEARYRGLVENSPTGILACDAQGQITSLNPNILTLLGSPSAEATMAINLFDFKPLTQAGISASFKQVFDTGEPCQAEHCYTSNWGKKVQIMAYYGPIKDKDGKTIGAQANVQDITDFKRSQEELASRLEELQRWQNVMLDREDRVQELKREVNELCRKVGESVRYPSQEEEALERDEPEL